MAGRNEGNKLALRGEFLPQQAWAQIEALTAKLQGSGALPNSIKNSSQLAMVLLAGYEAGMTPMESINSYYIVNGKVTIWGSAVLVQLRRAGYKIKWLKTDDKIASLELVTPDGRDKHEETYTIEEAKASGLTGKDTWIKYPKQMLRHKAIAQAVRFFCPEVLGGFYMKEEVEDPEESRLQREPDGKVVDVAAKEPGLPEDISIKVHEAWVKLADANGWNDEQYKAIFAKTILRYYGKEKLADLTEDEARDFIPRIKEAVEKKESEKTPPTPPTETPKVETPTAPVQSEIVTPEQMVTELSVAGETCPTCKVAFNEEKDKQHCEAIRFAGECNKCLESK